MSSIPPHLLDPVICWWTLAAAPKSHQSCPTLCDPIDGSPPGPAIPGILQARTLEWVAISSANAWKWKVKVKSLSHVRLLATPWTAAYQAPPSVGFSRREYWSGVPLPSPPCCYRQYYFILFMSNIPLYMYTPHLLDPVICWWTLSLLLYLGNCK